MTDFLTLQPSDAPFTKGDEIEFREKTGVNLRDFFNYWDLTRQVALSPEDKGYLDDAALSRAYIQLRSGYSHVNEDKCAAMLVFIQYKKTNPTLTIDNVHEIDSRDFMDILQRTFEHIVPQEPDSPLEETSDQSQDLSKETSINS